jgi:hypothetical protein
VEDAGALGTIGDEIGDLGGPNRGDGGDGGAETLRRDHVAILRPDHHLKGAVGGRIPEDVGDALAGLDLRRVGGEALVAAGHLDLTGQPPEDSAQDQGGDDHQPGEATDHRRQHRDHRLHRDSSRESR